jgi:SAM-dependent methyltransferase
MDRFIAKYQYIIDKELHVCAHRGVAYQGDLLTSTGDSHHRVAYDDAYYMKVKAYENSAIENEVLRHRLSLISRHAGLTTLLDIGAGTGAFIRAASERGHVAKGYDIMPEANAQLQYKGMYCDDVDSFMGICMWDTIEHMYDAGPILDRIPKPSFLFVSIPVFSDLYAIRASKHYRPGEHFYYWTVIGFANWIRKYGFSVLEVSGNEMLAGRDSVVEFACIKS